MCDFPPEMTPLDNLDAQIENIKEQMRSYLRNQGWEDVCNTPGSLWLWQRNLDGRVLLVPEQTAIKMQKTLDLEKQIRKSNGW